MQEPKTPAIDHPLEGMLASYEEQSTYEKGIRDLLELIQSLRHQDQNLSQQITSLIQTLETLNIPQNRVDRRMPLALALEQQFKTILRGFDDEMNDMMANYSSPTEPEAQTALESYSIRRKAFIDSLSEVKDKFVQYGISLDTLIGTKPGQAYLIK